MLSLPLHTVPNNNQPTEICMPDCLLLMMTMSSLIQLHRPCCSGDKTKASLLKTTCLQPSPETTCIGHHVTPWLLFFHLKVHICLFKCYFSNSVGYLKKTLFRSIYSSSKDTDSKSVRYAQGCLQTPLTYTHSSQISYNLSTGDRGESGRSLTT